ncbi:hypothetical protein Bpfe_028875, partial [Biomphalaria pfeifferi]
MEPRVEGGKAIISSPPQSSLDSGAESSFDDPGKHARPRRHLCGLSDGQYNGFDDGKWLTRRDKRPELTETRLYAVLNRLEKLNPKTPPHVSG